MARLTEKPERPEAPSDPSSLQKSAPIRRISRSGSLPSDLSAYIVGLSEKPLLSREEERAVAARINDTRLALARALFEDPYICRIAIAELGSYLSNNRKKSSPIRFDDKTKQQETNSKLRRYSTAALGLCSRLEFAYASGMAMRSAIRGLPENTESIDKMRRRFCDILVKCDFETAFLEKLHQLFKLSVTRCQELKGKMHKDEPPSVRRNAAKLLRGFLIDHCRSYEGLMNHSRRLSPLQTEMDKAVEELFLANRRLVVKFAGEFKAAGKEIGLPLTDLIHEGNIGLVRAVKKFDLRRGFKFSTYAVWWIRQHIWRCIVQRRKEESHKGSWSTIKQSLNVRTGLSHELGHAPTEFDVAQRMKVPEAELLRLRRSHPIHISIDGAVDDSNGMAEYVSDSVGSDEIFKTLANRELAQKIAQVMKLLPPRYSTILSLRFLSPTPKTLEEVGSELGLTRERIRQLESKALKALRNRGVWETLKSFLEDHNQAQPSDLSLYQTDHNLARKTPRSKGTPRKNEPEHGT